MLGQRQLDAASGQCTPSQAPRSLSKGARSSRKGTTPHPQWADADKENTDSTLTATAAAAPASRRALSQDQVSELYKNCIKLASENKISQKNTWSLQLIDHLSDLVKPNAEDGSCTNFQRASCTLDAGVKIYSHRVDSVHSEAFKVLGGLSRSTTAHAEDDGDEGGGNDEGEGGQSGGRRRKIAMAEVDPCSTLESSFEALNVKKFDLAFAVDPLFQKTSAQFDEGGAQGLLLNTLSVYRGCEIVFDSLDVPEEALAAAADGHADVQIDLSSLQQQLDIAHATTESSITPSLAALSQLLGQHSAPDAAEAAAQLIAEAAAGRSSAGAGDLASDRSSGMDLGGGSRVAHAAQNSEQPADMPGDLSDDGYDGGDMGYESDGGSPTAGGGRDSWLGDEPSKSASAEPQQSSRSREASTASVGLGQEAIEWLMEAGSGWGPVTRGAGWAGASHWRFRAASDPADTSQKPAAATRSRKKAAMIDFENLPPLPPYILKLATRKEQICLKTMTPKDTLLPEDLHYEAKQLARLFLKPSMTVCSRSSARDRSSFGDSGGCADSDDGGDFGVFDDGSDADEPQQDAWACMQHADDIDDSDLISAPRKVAQTSISHARASKQVDVKALKEALWSSMQAAKRRHKHVDTPLHFQDVIAAIANDCGAGRLCDISVHLCFICLLHLANEHGLKINDAADLNSLTIENVTL